MVLAHDISKGDRTKDVKITQNITFETMLLSPDTLKGLKDSGFYKPSPIQLYGIPIGKCGFDLLLEAKSGTGKTAVFTIIALEKLNFSKGLQVVILTPTREIAAQICDVLKEIGSRYKDLQVEVVMGGMPLRDDIEKFKKPVHIVVGSPGRLKQLIHNNFIDVKSVRLLVFDEADKLMESGFQSDIKFIHTSLPKQKQVIMSSATYPTSSKDLINSYVQNASHVCPDSDCVLLGIDQKVSIVKYNNNIVRHTQERFKELLKILGRLQFKQCLVFCNYQVRVAEVHKLLKKEEWPSQQLYGQQEQVDRLDALKTLQQYKCRILVSTDLAARGIDASNVDLVVNFEPPYEWPSYLHRIGRAGRFGSYGLAVTIVSEGKELEKFKSMLKPMQISINHLWTEREFNTNTSGPNTPSELNNVLLDNPTSSKLFENVSSKAMWELLSSDNNPSNSIKSDKECDKESQENLTTSKIESFSELMLSLKDHCQDTNNDIIFKNTEMKKASENICMVQQNSIIDLNTVSEEVHKNDEDSNYSINKKRNDLRIIAETSTNINGNKNSDVNEGKFDEEYNASKILSSLDLPVMFSSSKYKTWDTTRKFNKPKFSNKKKNRSSNYENLDINNAQSQLEENAITTEINCRIVNNNNSYKNRQIHCKDSTKNINHCNRINSYNDKYSSNDPQQKDYRLNIRKKTLQYSIEQQTNLALYRNWYNQLKMQMKHIEQKIYIDEISRL